MSYATQALKRALLHDEGAATVYLSPHIPGLGAARDVLLAAFGNQDVLLKQVRELDPPANSPEGVDLLCLGGKGDIFNYQALDVYLEFGLRDANLLTMLILVPLPQQWDVHKVFDTLSPDILPAQGALTQATIVISYGLAAVPDSQIISEYDRQNPNSVDIARYPLQNGLQILAAGVAAVGGAVDDEVLKEARAAGIPPSHLPELTTLPNRVEIRADVHAGWLVLERWWGDLKPASSLAENVYPVGLAYRYSLTDANDFYHYWLLEVGAPEQPIVLEARVLDMDMVGQPNAFFPVRYTSRFAARTPLKQAAQALAALLGEQAIIFAAQGLELPDDITLLGFSYAPGEWLQCTFAAGDSTRQDAYLLHAGPLELREVDFTVWAPIGASDNSASIELEATTSFFGEQFRVRVRPWTLIEGGLDDLDGVDLGGLVERLLPAPLPFGLNNVHLTQAWVSHAMSSREGEASFTSLTLRLDGKVELLPGAIELDEIALLLSEDSDGSKNASLSAQFRFGSSFEMSALASYDGGDWIFSGEVGGEGEGVHIKDLIDQIAHLFGASVPAEDAVPDVTLESFSLQYETQARTLTIHAVADWKIPDDIPVLGETDNRVLLQVTTAPAGALAEALASQQGESDTALTIEWTLQKGNYELDANVALAKEAQTYSVDFSAPDSDQPVTLTDLTSAIGLPDIPRPEAGLLDSVFEVSHLALDYDHTEKTFSVAWSRPLGKGIFLVEYNQSGSNQPDHAGGSAKAGATNRFVEVSWLGNEETSTLGIQEILKLTGQEHLEDDLKDMVGDEIVTKIDDFLSFKQLGFSWQENDQENILTFTALSKNQAQAFIAVRTGENAGLVAGIAFAGSDEDPAHSMADDLTFLPEGVNDFLKVVEDVLEHIELTHFLFSTVSSSAYQPPAFAASAMQPSYARQDAAAPSYPFGAGTMALGQGVSVGVRVKFGQHDIVRRLIDLDELHGQVTIGEVVAVQVSIPGSLKLDAGGGNSLALTSPVLRIKDNLEIPEAGPEFDIMGGLDIHFSGQRLQMAGWLALAEESLTGHIQLTELALPIPLTPIYLLPGVQLVINKDKPLSLDLGLQFEPSGLDLGLSGSFAIYKDDKDLVYGDAGFVLELVEEIPQPLYVEFGADELSIPVLLEAVTGLQYRLHLADSAAKLAAEGAQAAERVSDLAGGEAGSPVKAASDVAEKAAKGASAAIEAAESALGHLEAILSKVELKDVRFHWADSIVNLPDGSTVMPGVGIRGGLRVFDWDAFAVLDLSTQGIPGFSGHLEAEKIEIGRILKIWGDGKGIHKTPATAEDFNQQVKSKVDAMAAGQLRRATPALAKDEGDWFLEPGGPVLHLSTRSAPFLHADLHAQLFGFLQTDIHADITEEGFDFDFKIGAGNAVTAELECHWWHKEEKLEAHGDLGIHLHGDIGPIIPHVAATQFHLDTDLDAHVSLMVDSQEFKLTVNGSFEYQGASLHLPELVLEEQLSTLEEMAKKIWEHVVAEAEQIFEEYLAPIGKFVADGAEEVKQVAVAAAKEVAEVASAAAGEAKQIVSDVADTMNKAAGDIGQAAQNLAGEAETLASNAAQAALDAAAPLLEKVSDLGGKALQFAADAADSVKAIVADAVALVSEAAHYAIRVAAEAAQWVAGKLDDARRWVSARMDQAIALVNELAQEAEAAVRAIEADIEEIENKIKELFSRAAEEAEDTLSGGWHAATSWLAG